MTECTKNPSVGEIYFDLRPTFGHALEFVVTQVDKHVSFLYLPDRIDGLTVELEGWMLWWDKGWVKYLRHDS